MSFSNFVFDFDGTLVDSMPTWTEKMLRILQKEGIDYSDSIITAITPLGDIGAIQYFKNVLGAKASIDEMIEEMDSFALPKYQNTIRLKEGVLEYLTLLKKNNYSICILTASPHKMIIPCLEQNGIHDMFDHIWSCEDFGKSKSDPSIYEEMLSRLKSDPEETVFFDDNIYALQTAASCGLYTVGVYDDSSKGFVNEIKHAANAYIDSFFDLSNILKDHLKKIVPHN